MATRARRRWPPTGKKTSRQDRPPLIQWEAFLDAAPVLPASKSSSSPEPRRIELSEAEFDALVYRLERNELSASDIGLIRDIIRAVLWMGGELAQKTLSIHRLRRLFGVKTETLSTLFPDSENSGAQGHPEPQADANSADADADHSKPPSQERQQQPPPGHGRLGAKDFPDARCVFHPHESLKAGDRCPECKRGNLYALEPGTVLRILGQAPFDPVLHQPERLRCS